MDNCDCPYAILSVPRNATLGQIKSSYRKLALRHHPDKGGDEAMFKIISAAYEILSDDARRAERDRLQQEKAATAGADRGASSASASGGRRRSRPAASATPQQQSQSSDSDAFSHPFFQQHHGFGNGSSFRTQFTDPFDLFERMFGEEFGMHSSIRRGRGSGGLAGHRFSSSATRSGTGSRTDPFDDPFFANSRSMMGMGRSGMGNGSMMDEMSQRMGTMQQSMMSSFHSSFGSHHGHAGSVGHHHSSHHGGAATGNGQPSFSSSFSMSSSSGFGGGGFGGGRSVSTSTTTRIVNGVQETTTEQTVVHPDGRVERSSSVSTSNRTGMALGAGNDRHRRYIDQGRR